MKFFIKIFFTKGEFNPVRFMVALLFVFYAFKWLLEGMTLKPDNFFFGTVNNFINTLDRLADMSILFLIFAVVYQYVLRKNQ